MLVPGCASSPYITRALDNPASRGSSGSGDSSPENNNYLRVSAAFGQRRLSDNVLTAPGQRRLSGGSSCGGASISSAGGSAPGR